MLSVKMRVTRGHRAFALDANLAPGIVALVGPSGAGKSSLVGGLCGVTAANGTITLSSVNWLDPRESLPPEARDLGVAFQKPLLFPHLSVAQNVRFGLHKVEAQEERIDEALSNCEAGHLRHREVRNLSGGEAQRVSIARAMAKHAKVLILDEPFAPLDRNLRLRIGEAITAYAKRHEAIVILTAHDEMVLTVPVSQTIVVSEAN